MRAITGILHSSMLVPKQILLLPWWAYTQATTNCHYSRLPADHGDRSNAARPFQSSR